MLQKRLLFGLVMIVAVVISSCAPEGVECPCGELAVEFEEDSYVCLSADQALAIIIEIEGDILPEDFDEIFYEVWAEEVGTCEEASSSPLAPGLWPSDVCEPNGGFSGDGWNTWDTNADDFGYSTVLYVGTSAEGPWFATEYVSTPYVFSMASLQGLADWMGVASYEQLWFKVSEAGAPVNWASAIADRDGHMDALCGVE